MRALTFERLGFTGSICLIRYTWTSIVLTIFISSFSSSVLCAGLSSSICRISSVCMAPESPRKQGTLGTKCELTGLQLRPQKLPQRCLSCLIRNFPTRNNPLPFALLVQVIWGTELRWSVIDAIEYEPKPNTGQSWR
jgi:hypothetical protein